MRKSPARAHPFVVLQMGALYTGPGRAEAGFALCMQAIYIELNCQLSTVLDGRAMEYVYTLGDDDTLSTLQGCSGESILGGRYIQKALLSINSVDLTTVLGSARQSKYATLPVRSALPE